jgi:hypothetical protein
MATDAITPSCGHRLVPLAWIVHPVAVANHMMDEVLD